MNGFPNPLNQMLSGMFSGDAFKSGLGELLNGLKMTYDKMCEIAIFTAPPTAGKVKAGTTTGTAGLYNAADEIVMPMRAKRFDLFLYDNNLFLKWGLKKGGTMNDEVEYIAPGFYSIPAAAGFIALRSVNGGTVGRYTLVIYS